MKPFLKNLLLLCSVIGMFGCHTIPDKQWVLVCEPGQSCDDHALDHAIQPPKDSIYIDSSGWHTRRAPPAEVQPPNWVRTEFVKAYLEFDQQGRPFDPRQLEAIQRYLQPKTSTSPTTPLLILVYVHGWHHNADTSQTDETANVVKFDYLLARAVDSLKRTGHGNYRVLGIYVGWQGEQTRVPIASLLSIGARAAVADAIGRPQAPDGATEGRLRDSLQKIATDMRARKDDSRMIVIGHSLGGRILSRAFMAELAEGNPQPMGPGTIVNPINAAIGAEAYRNLFERHKSSIALAGPPTWINITGDTDHATGQVYPLALALHLLHPDNDGEDAKHTVGHHLPYVTHTFDVKDCAVNDEKGARGCEPSTTMDLLVQKRAWETLATPFALRYTNSHPIENGSPAHRDYCGLFLPRVGFAAPYRTAASAGICLGLVDDVRHIASGTLDMASGPLNGRLWNIRTSDRVIDFAESRFFEFSTHNGYVQTNWTRLLVELVMADTIYPPKDQQSAASARAQSPEAR